MKNKIVKQSLKNIKKFQILKNVLWFLGGIFIGSLLITSLVVAYIIHFENQYHNRIYPGVRINQQDVSGLTMDEIKTSWTNNNQRFTHVTLTFSYEDTIATVSADKLNPGFDATTSATQAYLIGRSGNFFADWYNKYVAWRQGITLSPPFYWKQEPVVETLDYLGQQIDIPAQDALFEFENGRVSEFKPAKPGRTFDKQAVFQQVSEQFTRIAFDEKSDTSLIFPLPVVAVDPSIKTEAVNGYGIKELIGSGESYFRGSIAGRVHNVALAASRINGVLVKPGETFSFNRTVGDISAATGYKQAYVIKSGRTVLDDGGGVCQVSTTLFRAILDAGLPIVERHAHSYRVGYYEQGGWKPGFDATVYSPTYDLKFTNDTSHYILIQAKTDTANTHLTFELYGTKDGREIAISPVKLWDSRPAPPDLIQDDPTLPNGTMKQVDWAAPGLKATFDYTVSKNGETVFEKSFYSNYVPWQAVFLKGTGA
ncbi:hypothetical protein C4579_04140 [Candidatus Microgenomates bacterium]|nr:MAG: hypothetical protein C4579_04140 [Candidatus Microgenomates bacterium]